MSLSEPESENTYPLSPMQEGILFHSLYNLNTDIYLMQRVYSINGDLNSSILQSAWQQIIDSHEILRAGFIWETVNSPLQIIYKKVSLPWIELDWSSLPQDEQTKKLEEFLTKDRSNRFIFENRHLCVWR